MRIILATLIAFTTLAWTGETGPTYYKAKALDGDGVFSLLRRYDLIAHPVNVQKFYELNGMQGDALLIKGRRYVLPIRIFKYDGKSIRSTIGIDDWDKAVRIANFNNLALERGLRQTTYQASGVLWVPMHELKYESHAKAAAEVTSLRVPLFGPAHADIALESDKLRGRAFYIVSGHGGPDPGAMSRYAGRPLCEDEYAYDVSLRLARNLMAHGATVEIIIQDPDDGIRSGQILDCDKEELCMGKTPIPLWQLERLKQRVFAVNDLHKKHSRAGIADHTVVCIHVDSRNPQKRQDVFFYYFSHSEEGRALAENLQQTFSEKYKKNRPNGRYHGTVSSRDLYVLKYTDPPAVYVELANIQNAVDLKRILPEDNRQALANWLFEGLTQ